MTKTNRTAILAAGLAAIAAMSAGADGSKRDGDERFFVYITGVPVPATNANGELAWGESYRLGAIMDLWEATADPRCLELFAERAAAVMAVRDDRLGLVDEYRGRAMPAWGSSRYNDGHWAAWIGHTGMLLLPFARFAMASRNLGFPEALKPLADELARGARESIDAFDAELDWQGDEAYYLGPLGEPWMNRKPRLAFNLVSVAASAMMVLDDYFGTAVYDERVRGLALAMERYLTVADDGRVYWQYMPFWWSWRADTSHAAQDASFLARCQGRGLGFDAATRTALEKAFLTIVWPTVDRVTEVVDGTGEGSLSVVWRWAPLYRGSPLERSYADRLAALIATGTLSAHDEACAWAAWRLADSRAPASDGKDP